MLGPVVELGEAADRGQVVGRPLQRGLERFARFLVAAQIEHGPSEGHARREVIGELLEAVLAELDGAVEVAGAPEALGDAAERRRVLGGHLPLAIENESLRHGCCARPTWGAKAWNARASFGPGRRPSATACSGRSSPSA